MISRDSSRTSQSATWRQHRQHTKQNDKRQGVTPRTFLSAAEERAVFLQTKVNLDEVRTGEELHDHAAGDDRRDAELHEGAAVGREDDAHPVERVTGV